MSFPLFDLIVVGVIIISALLAAVRGFTREVLAIASWVVAAVAALVLHPMLLPIVKEHIANPTVALVATIGAIFLVALIIVSFITVRLSDMVLDSRIGAIDRTMGFLFGAARGVLICVIGYLFFSWLVPDKMQPQWARDAKSRYFLQRTGEQLMAMLPDDPESTILKRLKRPKLEGDAADAPAESDPTSKTPAPAPTPAKPGRRT